MWTLGGIRIYKQGRQQVDDTNIARLDTVGTGPTILHFFGNISATLRSEVLVLTDEDLEAIIAMKGTSQELIGPEGSQGNWIVKSIDSRREMSNWHVFFDRPGEDINAPLYRVNLELYEDA